MISHADLRDMINAHALGALDRTDSALMQDHLDSCAFCANLAREASDVTHHLALGVPYYEPPAGSLERLLATVEARLGQPVAAAGARRRGFPGSMLWPTAGAFKLAPLAASLVMVLGLGAWNLHLTNELSENRQQMSLLHDRLSEQTHLMVMFTSRESFTKPLQSTPLAPSAQVRLIMDDATNSAMLMASHLPPLPRDQVYEVWLGRQGARLPAGRLLVDQNGNGECSLQLDGSIHAYDSAWITLEPADGGFAPTGPGVATGQL